MTLNPINPVALEKAREASQSLKNRGVANPSKDEIVVEMNRLAAQAEQSQNEITMFPQETQKTSEKTWPLDAKLQNLETTKESADTINMQIKAEEVKQNILQEAQTLNLEGVANAPDTTKQAEVVDQFIKIAVNGEEAADTNADSLKNIVGTRLSDDQKATLKADLEAIKGMDLKDLSSEFGIDIDFSELENLGEDAKPEDVKAQLKVVEDILAQVKGTAGDPPTGLEKVKAERKKADKNIAYNNKTIAYYEDLYNKRIANGELKKDDPNPYADKIAELQQANVAALKVVAKADSLDNMLKPVTTQLTDLKTILTKEDTHLTNIAKFDTAAEKRKAEQIAEEDRTRNQALKDEEKAKGKRDKAVVKMSKAKEKDKDLEKYEGDKDVRVQEKVDKKHEKVEERQKTVDDAIKDRTAAEAVIERRNDKQKQLDELRGTDAK